MRCDWKRLVCEGPQVVGMLSSSLRSGESIDTAIRYVAADGPLNTAELFTEAVRLTDTKGSAGISQAVSRMMDDIPGKASGYRHAVMLCIAASESEDDEETSRLLDEASRISLDSVRAMGESYSSSLNVPCTAVFGLGIILPMIMMSIIPLLNIGGVFGSGPVGSEMIAIATVVVIPTVILLMAMAIGRMNPFSTGTIGTFPKESLVLFASVPLTLILRCSGVPTDISAAASLMAASAACAALMTAGHRKERTDTACVQGMADSMFDIGNRMVSGESFETACTASLSTRAECSAAGERLGRELDLCRGDIDRAIGLSVGELSDEMASAFVRIRRCSAGSVEDAGRLAMMMGRQFHDRTAVLRKLETELKSMTDMMIGTAVLFAPMILGMSVSMLGPLSELSGTAAAGGSEPILGVYVVELCLLISVLTSNLGSGGSIGQTVRRFSMMMPAALAVFMVCCRVSL